jgi:hypothetical protein
LRQFFQRIASRVLHPHVMAAGSKQISDAVAIRPAPITAIRGFFMRRR